MISAEQSGELPLPIAMSLPRSLDMASLGRAVRAMLLSSQVVNTEPRPDLWQYVGHFD